MVSRKVSDYSKVTLMNDDIVDNIDISGPCRSMTCQCHIARQIQYYLTHLSLELPLLA